MYKINELAKLAGVTTRTLRYYDKIDLLKPNHITESGYRIYTSIEVDILQSIMFFKELGYELLVIKQIITKTDFNLLNSLQEQLRELLSKKSKIDELISLVEETINLNERNIKMSDEKKFKAFKEKKIRDNNDQYGEELIEKYDEKFVQDSNEKYLNKSKYEFEQQELLNQELNDIIIKAVKTNSPSSDLAVKMCELHKKWIMFYWPKYSKEAHLSLVKMYTTDERFTKYYDKISEGSAVFLYKAMKQYLDK